MLFDQLENINIKLNLLQASKDHKIGR